MEANFAVDVNSVRIMYTSYPSLYFFISFPLTSFLHLLTPSPHFFFLYLSIYLARSLSPFLFPYLPMILFSSLFYLLSYRILFLFLFLFFPCFISVFSFCLSSLFPSPCFSFPTFFLFPLTGSRVFNCFITLSFIFPLSSTNCIFISTVLVFLFCL